MIRKPSALALAALTACTFLAGMLLAGTHIPNASAQAASGQSLPPIFEVGNTVTFGPRGVELTIQQIQGDWIFAEQSRPGGFATTETTPNKFWLYVPAVQDSWRLVERK